jgi:hypothetical protein
MATNVTVGVSLLHLPLGTHRNEFVGAGRFIDPVQAGLCSGRRRVSRWRQSHICS